MVPKAYSRNNRLKINNKNIMLLIEPNVIRKDPILLGSKGSPSLLMRQISFYDVMLIDSLHSPWDDCSLIKSSIDRVSPSNRQPLNILA